MFSFLDFGSSDFEFWCMIILNAGVVGSLKTCFGHRFQEGFVSFDWHAIGREVKVLFSPLSILLHQDETLSHDKDLKLSNLLWLIRDQANDSLIIFVFSIML